MLPSLRADCARCAALCCVALSFDRSLGFPLDKPAGKACPHLTADARCAIHHARESQGFGGCVGYDCLGAGQRVTALLALWPGWSLDRSTLSSGLATFERARRVHQLLELLGAIEGWLPRASAKLALEVEPERSAWIERLSAPLPMLSEEAVTSAETGVERLLARLKRSLPAHAPSA